MYESLCYFRQDVINNQQIYLDHGELPFPTSTNSLHAHAQERKINLSHSGDDGMFLGFNIRGGAEFDLPVFVSRSAYYNFTLCTTIHCHVLTQNGLWGLFFRLQITILLLDVESTAAVWRSSMVSCAAISCWKSTALTSRRRRMRSAWQC